MSKRLSFRPDGIFTIVQFTDVHWQNGEPEDLKSQELMKRVLEAERPDLVVFTGDQIRGEYCQDPFESMRQSVVAVNQSGAPWVVLFGNHDDECGATREQLLQVQQESSLCMTERGPLEITGVGNFTITIEGADQTSKAALYFIDSGTYAPGRTDEYAWIDQSQIDWYRSESRKLTEQSNGPLPALAFFHIPTPEYQLIWDRTICYGSKHEGVGSPKHNSGFMHAIVDCGDVMGTFVGHDHINDYWGKYEGIRLCYGRATGYNTYGLEGFPRGARVIRLQEGVRDFQSWIRLDDGSVISEQKPHMPEGLSTLDPAAG